MKHRSKIVLVAAAAVLFGSAFWRCGVDENFAVSQRAKIESYLNSHSLTATTTITADSVYVVAAGNSLATPPAQTAATGDSVIFDFAAYVFRSAPSDTVYYTNKRWLALTLPTHLNYDYWDFDPVKIKLGDGKVIKGVESALLSCRAGDSLAAFITSNLAYGGEAMGVVPANSAVMMVLTVSDVIKE